MRDITLCHPRLQKLAVQMVESAKRQNLKIKIGETFRTVAEQDALYAQGRTKPGKIVTNAPGKNYSSYHQWGTAFDVYRDDGHGAYNESGKFFERVGAIGVSLGLEWGGNWKTIVDKPHSVAGLGEQYEWDQECVSESGRIYEDLVFRACSGGVEKRGWRMALLLPGWKRAICP